MSSNSLHSASMGAHGQGIGPESGDEGEVGDARGKEAQLMVPFLPLFLLATQPRPGSGPRRKVGMRKPVDGSLL